MSNGDFSAFLEALGAFESGIDPNNILSADYYSGWRLSLFEPDKGNVDPASVDLTNPQDLQMLQYHVHNTLGFLGKYQFGEPLLIDLGYYSPAATGFYGSTATNEWQGTWTGKNGVYSKEDFMSEVQELAIREAFAMNMNVMEARFAQAGHTLEEFIGQTFTYEQGGVTHTAEVTMTGILASAHLQGPGGVANLLLNGAVSSDEYGTNILSYMDKFGGYSSPFGTSGDDVLTGSDYSETFLGGDGDDIATTGGGNDKIVLTDNPGTHDVVTDFDVNQDVLSVEKLSDVSFNDMTVTTSAAGNALIAFGNGQTVELQGVDAASVNAGHVVQGVFKLGWNAGTNTVIDNFNSTHDIIDMNYAFASNNLSLYEQNGSTVIEILGNNQTFVLAGISFAELKPYNFIKAPHDFAEVHFGVTPPVVPPQDEPGDNTNDGGTTTEPPVVTPPPEPTPAEPTGDVYAFTWNWGSNAVVTDFDINTNGIDLSSFWTDYAAFTIADNADGFAVVDLTNINNQTILIEGVSTSELTASHFVGVEGDFSAAVAAGAPPVDDPVVPPVEDPVVDEPDPETQPPSEETGAATEYAYTWNWGSHEVITDFDVSQDSVNLSSFWTSYSAFSIYDNDLGEAVIDLNDVNQQSITLAGVSASSLTEANIIGVSGNFADGLQTGGGATTPPADTGGDTTPEESTTHNGTYGDTATGSDGHDVFAYTWAWGSNNEINNFTPGEDIVDLKAFWTTPDNVQIYNDIDGNAVIDLTSLNNQTITLNGVSAEELSDGDVLI